MLEKNVDDRHAEKIAAALTVIALEKYRDSDSMDHAGIAWTSALNKLTDLWADEPDSYVAQPDPTDPESFEPSVD